MGDITEEMGIRKPTSGEDERVGRARGAADKEQQEVQ